MTVPMASMGFDGCDSGSRDSLEKGTLARTLV